MIDKILHVSLKLRTILALQLISKHFLPNKAFSYQYRFNFVKIKSLQEVEVDSIVDVIGYVKECYPWSDITIRKTNEQKAKRNITIYDDSNAIIEIVSI